MNCGKCDATVDSDAAFCANCGQDLSVLREKTVAQRRRSYWYALLFVPVLLAAIGVGYYLFLLPSGVAAVVNGEEITLAELDAAAGLGPDAPADRLGTLRYSALSQLITERIACQEACRAGITVTAAEVNDAVDRLRSASGMDEQSFAARVKAQYGGMASFKKGLERRISIRKFIDERVVAGEADPALANARVERWLREITGRATVRVALGEGPSGAGCGCCNGSAKGPDQQGGGPQAGPGAGMKQGCGMKRGASSAGEQAQVQAARAAAIEHWQRKNGNGPVETKVTDFGCHVQVDILKESKIVQSLRYQNGTITEL